jgi:hypothetical protein
MHPATIVGCFVGFEDASAKSRIGERGEKVNPIKTLLNFSLLLGLSSGFPRSICLRPEKEAAYHTYDESSECDQDSAPRNDNLAMRGIGLDRSYFQGGGLIAAAVGIVLFVAGYKGSQSSMLAFGLCCAGACSSVRNDLVSSAMQLTATKWR